MCRWFPALLLLASLTSCDSSRPSPSDRGIDRARVDARRDLLPELPLGDLLLPDLLRPDRPRADRAPPDAGPTFDGGVPSKDFVLDSILVPTSDADAKKYALDFNGKSYNALGALLAAIASSAPNLEIQRSMTLAVNMGSVLELLRVQAQSFSTSPAALVKMWRGQSQSCCSTVTDLSTCISQAKAGCFSGSHTFLPDSSSTGTSAVGSITAGAMSFGPAPLKLDLALATASTMTLTLKQGRITGQLGVSQITDGVIAGAIPQTEVTTILIPGLAALLDDLLHSAFVDPTAKTLISTLFDANKDGSITATELAQNALIKAFLAGDVDVDGDGVPELSLGLGFTAVGATITAP